MGIETLAKSLRLPYIRDNHGLFIDEARHTQMDYMDFLEKLLENEMELRKENGTKRKIKNAKFPYKKYLEDFDRSRYGPEFRCKFKEFDSLEFIDKKENIILIGSPGAGKTHYAIGVGIKACLAGKTVLFASVPNLVIELKEAMSQHQFNAYKKKFEKYDLVILDEMGYISFDRAGCEILFNLLSNRNDKGSIIITTNLTFDRWEEIFRDAILTGAIVDRLAHKAHVLDISRETSHRYEETLSWLRASEKVDQF